MSLFIPRKDYAKNKNRAAGEAEMANYLAIEHWAQSVCTCKGSDLIPPSVITPPPITYPNLWYLGAPYPMVAPIGDIIIVENSGNMSPVEINPTSSVAASFSSGRFGSYAGNDGIFYDPTTQAVIGGIGAAGGGFTVYNSAGAIIAVTNPPTGAYDVRLASVGGGFLYVQVNYGKAVYQYNIATNVWAELVNTPPAPSSGNLAVIASGNDPSTIYFTDLGFSGSLSTTPLWKYDISSSTLTALPTDTTAVIKSANNTFIVNGTLYICEATAGGSFSGGFIYYNIASETWGHYAVTLPNNLSSVGRPCWTASYFACLVSTGGTPYFLFYTPGDNAWHTYIVVLPVSGEDYQNVEGQEIGFYQDILFSPTSNAAASAVVALGPQPSPESLYTKTYPASAVSPFQDVAYISIPDKWYYSITLTNATFVGTPKRIGR